MESTEDGVLAVARRVLGRPDLGMDDDVFDCGASSLAFVRILAEVAKDLGVAVDVAALAGVATARNIAAHAAVRTGSAAGA